MKREQLDLAWKKVIQETHKRPKLGKQLKDKNISLLGELLLYAQVLLDKIEKGEDSVFNEMIYKMTIKFYCAEMKKYV